MPDNPVVVGLLLSNGELVTIRERDSGNYTITLLGDTDELRQSSNHMALEFRDASTHELTEIGNPQIQATMPMPGMAPMFGDVSSPNPTTPGRYEFDVDFSMVGGWSLIVTFDPDARVQSNVNAY